MGGISNPGASLIVQGQGANVVASTAKANFSDMGVTLSGTDIAVIDAVPLYYGSQWAISISPGTAGVTGLSVAGATGVAVTATVARSIASGNAFTIRRRVALSLGAVSNSTATIRASEGSCLGDAGFKFYARWGVETFVADCKMLMGVSLNSLTGGQEPSTSINCFFVGFDSTDTNLQVMHNDGSGACTKINLGASFPARSALADIYQAVLTCAAGGASYSYKVTNLISGVSVSGTINANMPLASQLMSWRLGYYTHATAGPIACSIFGAGGKDQLTY